MAIFGRSGPAGGKGLSPFKAGLLAIVLVVVGTYFAYTKANPFADPYEFSASFTTANNIAADSPVRIAGVEVGVVKEVAPVEGGGEGATVTMEIEDHGLPIHVDAELKIRPRIFLEGNEFVDLEPGSPSAPVLDNGGTIPVNQTATPVQLGQVLSVLQSDTREDLKTFLQEYSLKALKGGGAKSFNRSIEYWEEAYRNSAIANEALLGTQPGDLFRVLRGQQQTFAALASQPDALQGLVSNFNTTAAAFAAEDDALQATVPALRDVLAVGQPALASLNSSFPGIQRFANDALPGVRSSQETIPAAFPLIRQLNLLFRPSELRGTARALRQTVPALTRVNFRSVPFLNQNRALSACTNEVLLPFARTPIPSGSPGEEPADSPDAQPEEVVGTPDFPDDDYLAEPFYKQGPRSFVGLAGESRTSDANGKFFRVNFKLDNAVTLFRTGSGTLSEEPFALLGRGDERSRPAPPPFLPDERDGYRKPSFRPDFPCEESVTPDLRAEEAGTSIEEGGLETFLGDLPVDAELLRNLIREARKALGLPGGGGPIPDILPLATSTRQERREALQQLEESGVLEELDEEVRREIERLVGQDAGEEEDSGDSSGDEAASAEAEEGEG